MNKIDDLTGRRFGRLVVVKRVNNINNKTAWRCLCDCGNTISTTADNLKRSQTRSCGCLREELRIKNGHSNKKHGGIGTRLYTIYRGMWQRCYDKNANQYKRYGGRGICICEEWLGENEFTAFREWSIQNGYNDNLSIDRIDNNYGYYPHNCRWVTNKEQMNNRRCNVNITANGETHTMAEWAEITGINVSTIKSRRRAGWSDNDIINKKIDENRSTKTRQMNTEI